MKTIRVILSLLLAMAMLLTQISVFATGQSEPQKLFELDMSGFSLSTSEGSSSLVSSVANTNTAIEAYTTNSANLTITKNQFRNTAGGKTTYLSKVVTKTTWGQVAGRFALSDTSWDNSDISYEFWANINDNRWRNVAAIEMLWTTSDGTSGEKQITLDADTAGKQWNVSGGKYFSAPNGWHHVVITKPAKTSAEDGTTRSFEFYVDGVKRADASSIDIPSGATITDMRLLFGQSRTTALTNSTQHYLPADIRFGGISIYNGVLTEAQIKEIFSEEKPLYTPGEPKLLFDMDLTDFDPASSSASKGIKNSVAETGTATGIEAVGGLRTGTSVITGWFEKGSYINTLENNVPYVSLRQQQYSSAVAATNARIFIDNSGWEGNSYTTEAWIKAEYPSNNSAYSYAQLIGVYGGQSDERANGLEDYACFSRFNGINIWNFAKPSTNNYKTIAGTGDTWMHVVITRSVNNGVASHEAYINGVKQYVSGDLTATSAATGGRAGVFLGSLSAKAWYVSSELNVADVKVYEDVLSSEEIARHYNDELAAYTPAEVNIKFVNDSGEEVTNLNNLTNVSLKYTSSNQDTVWLLAACYDTNGNLIDAYNKEATTTGEMDIDIPQGTESMKGFIWDKATLTPLKESILIEYAEGYDPSAVTLEAAFYDDTNSIIKYMAGKTGIHAKANISSLLPPEDMTAELKLVRDGENVFADETDVVFTNRAAEVSISLGEVTPREGDELVFTLYDSDRTYIIKRLKYADASSILDIILVAGQSNALGQGGSASQSIRPEAGTVFYNTMNTQLTSNQGWDSALGKTWHDETGHTVLIVKATWGGTGFPTKPNLDTGALSTSGSDTYGWWNPGNSGSKTGIPYDCYTLAKEKYAAAVASIDTDKYTIGNCVYFWNQGENENNSYTAEQYEAAFLELHNKFKTEFGTEATRLTYGGILPVRSSYSKGFPNLKLTGPRIAQYNMAKKYDELFIVSDATEHWYSDSAIKEWFAKEYDGIVYPLDEIPTSWSGIMNTDNVHYKQAAMNEMGKEAAKSMLAYLKEDNAPTGIDLITPNGIEHYSDGDSITLTAEGAIPVIPVSVGTKASFAVSGSAAIIDVNGVLKPGEALLNDYAVMTVTPETGSAMTFKIYSPLVDDSINISAVKDNRAAIYSLTTDDNYSYTNKWIDDKLSEHGMVATMGLVTDWMGNSGMLTWQEAQALVDTGRWGVASHTKAHKQSTFASLTEAELDEEINGAGDVLKSYFPNEKLLAMYTPGGITSELIRKKVKENHHILRGAGGGNNSLPISETGMLALKSQYISSETTLDTMNGWVDTAIQNGQWIVEMWHGVGDTDAASWKGNTTVEIADAHIDYVAQKFKEGKLWVTTLDEAAVYMIQRLKSRIHIVSETEGQLVFTLTDELDDAVYDSALTVNIPIPSGYTTASVSQGGKSIDAVLSNGMVSITVKPDGGNITIDFAN